MINFVNPRYFLQAGSRFYDLTEQTGVDYLPRVIEIYGRTSEDLWFSHEFCFLIPEFPNRLGYNWIYKGTVYRIAFNRDDISILQ